MAKANELHQPTRWIRFEAASLDESTRLGTIGLRTRVEFFIEIGLNRPTVAIPFAVDSGASYSLMSLTLAQNYRIPIPPAEAEVELTLRTSGGLSSIRVRPGRIRLWWNENREGYPFDWPILFRTDLPIGVPPILGLGGIVKTCRWIFDGSYSPDFPDGFLMLEDIR